MSPGRSCAVIVLFGVLAQARALAAEPAAPTHIQVAPFGTVTVYKPTQAEPDSFALLMSGDGGWNLRGVNIARALASKGALVVGIDVRRFLATMTRSKSPCQPLA